MNLPHDPGDPARPLAGLTVVVTRSREQAAPLMTQLEALGATPLLFSTVAFAPVTPPDLHTALSEVDWVVFTSANAVQFFLAALAKTDPAFQTLQSIRIAAVGPATAQTLSACHLQPDLVPDRHDAQGVLHALTPYDLQGQRFLLPRSNLARPDLPTGLRERGAIVEELLVYQTLCPDNQEESRALIARLQGQQVQAITFTSPSAVTHFQKRLENSPIPIHNLLAPVLLAALGATTAQALADQLGRVDIQATTYSTKGLIDALIHTVQHRRRSPHVITNPS